MLDVVLWRAIAGHIVSRDKSNHSMKGLIRLYFAEIINKDKHERLKDLDENEVGTIFLRGEVGRWLLFESFIECMECILKKRLLCAVFKDA